MLNLDQTIKALTDFYEVGGFDAPLWVWIKLFSLAGIAVLLFFMLPRPGRSWRVPASRRWLKRFRKTAHRFSDRQRFSFIRSTNHFLFEDILMSAFEERGYKVRRTPATRDGGSDGFVDLDGLRLVIQAKRYKGPIAKQHVIALEVLARTNKNLDAGLFIHTGRTSGPIKSYISHSPFLDSLSGSKDILDFLEGRPVTIFGKRVRPAKAMIAAKPGTNRHATT